MSTKKICMLLATIMGMGMILCGIASAGDNQNRDIYFELRVRGNGIEITDDNATDDNFVSIEAKHILPLRLTIYAWVDRTDNQQNVKTVYYDADNESWTHNNRADHHSGCAKATDKGLLMRVGNVIYKGEDKIAIRTRTDTQVRFLEKDGIVKRAIVKTLGGTYQSCTDDFESADYEGAAAIKRRGGTNIRGRLIAWDDLPTDVRAVFTDMETTL